MRLEGDGVPSSERTARRGMLLLAYFNIGYSKTSLALCLFLNAAVFLTGVHIWVPQSVFSLKKREDVMGLSLY